MIVGSANARASGVFASTRGPAGSVPEAKSPPQRHTPGERAHQTFTNEHYAVEAQQSVPWRSSILGDPDKWDSAAAAAERAVEARRTNELSVVRDERSLGRRRRTEPAARVPRVLPSDIERALLRGPQIHAQVATMRGHLNRARELNNKSLAENRSALRCANAIINATQHIAEHFSTSEEARACAAAKQVRDVCMQRIDVKVPAPLRRPPPQ